MPNTLTKLNAIQRNSVTFIKLFAMKRLGLALLVLAACEESELVNNNFTGNEVVYALEPGSEYPISGTATLKEKSDGSTLVTVLLTGVDGALEHPVHLHLGPIGTPDAEVAALLLPIVDNSGRSETALSTLADETAITYAELVQLPACIKIHLASAGPGRDVILAAGNIGSAVSDVSNARNSIAVCK
jgi:hypothetical protein